MSPVFSNRKVQIALNGGFGGLLLGLAYLSMRHFVASGWPLHRADPVLVGGAALLYLFAYAFNACGWQLLFAEHERPPADALALAGGAACVGGIALPGRVDDAIRIACVRRFPGARIGFGALALSVILLALLDSAALAPLASVAAADASSWGARAGFGLIAAAGVAAAVVVAALPRLLHSRRLSRFRLCRWLGEHAACTRERWAAGLLVAVSWSLRGTAVFLLLNALSLRSSFPLALGFVCVSAASAAVPIGPAGAAMQAGAGAALLVLSGMPKSDSIAFSLAAQALVVVTGAAVVLLVAGRRLALRVRAARRPRVRIAAPAAAPASSPSAVQV